MDTTDLPTGKQAKKQKQGLQLQRGPLKLSGKRGSRTAKQLQRKIKKAEKVGAAGCLTADRAGRLALAAAQAAPRRPAQQLGCWRGRGERRLRRWRGRRRHPARHSGCPVVRPCPQAASVAERSVTKVSGLASKKQNRLSLKNVY